MPPFLQARGLFPGKQCDVSSVSVNLQVANQQADLTLKQVRDAVTFLMDNANIYTVSDENHYKSTKCD